LPPFKYLSKLVYNNLCKFSAILLKRRIKLILSEKSIKENINRGFISINPFDLESQLNGIFIDMTLSENFYRYSKEILYPVEMLDLKNPYFNILEIDKISDTGIVIEPGKILIAQTNEYIKVDNSIAVQISPKLRLSKMGINLLNTGIVDAGFEGNITLILHNSNDFPVRIFKDMKICHLSFIKVI
jgi:dCTP deaminase